tara:strand:- start:7038 stop:8540 length:1503 start_codon:yes stop_codon:yes gene_type:complete
MSDSKISNKKYTVNTYEWTGEEIHFLGKYLEAQADILKTAGGRWATHGHGNKIEIPNLSVLANSLESVGKVAWDMRCSVNLELGKQADTKERDKAIKQIRKWENLIAEEDDEDVLQAYEIALAKAQVRLDEVLKPKPDPNAEHVSFADSEDNMLREKDPLSKLYEDETLTGLEADLIHPVVRYMMRANSIEHVFEALNLPWSRVAHGQSKPDADILRWAFARFGYRWRTSDDKTRFDMPVERYAFSKSRERIKDLRAAANRWDKPFEIKLLKEDGRGKAQKSSDLTLRDTLDDLLTTSSLAFEAAQKNNTPALWLNSLAALLGYFPSMVPQGIWYCVTSRAATGYNSDLSRTLRELAEKRVDGAVSWDIGCEALQKAYYLRDCRIPENDFLSPDLGTFINLMSVILCRWTADVELTIAEKVYQNPTTGIEQVVRWEFPPNNPVVAYKDEYMPGYEEEADRIIPILNYPQDDEHKFLGGKPWFPMLPENMFVELDRRRFEA